MSSGTYPARIIKPRETSVWGMHRCNPGEEYSLHKQRVYRSFIVRARYTIVEAYILESVCGALKVARALVPASALVRIFVSGVFCR